MLFSKIQRDVLRDRERWRAISDYHGFCTGPDNPRGFRLTPKVEVGCVSVSMRIEDAFTGYPGIAHGGAVFAVLDDLMGWLVISHLGRAGFTTRSRIRYLRPLRANQRYRFRALPALTAAEEEGSIPKRVQLLGRVSAEDRNGNALVEMRAEMLLANRKTAERIIGRALDPIYAELFPET